MAAAPETTPERTEEEPRRGGADERREEPSDRAWHRRDPDAALEALDSGPDGLSDDDAQRRLEEHGENRIGKKRQVSRWEVLLHQFQSPLIYVLLGALVVTLATSMATGEWRWADAVVIGLVLLVNSTVGFFQEYRAEHAVERLMQMVAPKATVRRGGEARSIEATKIVPGDVVELEEGGVVPADLRLVESRSLQVNEAALTGESVPVDKTEAAMEDADDDLPPAERNNMAFMGTAVTSGRGAGVVVATARQTELGQIAQQVEEAGETQTPLQRRIQRLAVWITWAILAIAAVAFGVGLLMGRDWVSMITLAIALAVAAIPAGLPIVVTVALAIGVRRMAEQDAVIRHLPAVDTLGSCTTIVSDKTGTLTQNRMTVRALRTGDGRYDVGGEAHSAEGTVEQDGEKIEPAEHGALYEALLVGVLCNDASLPGERGEEESGEEAAEDEEREGDGRGGGDEEAKARDAITQEETETEQGEEAEEGEEAEDEEEPSGDPMEVALLYAGAKAGLRREALRERYPRVDEVPFQTERRFMATIHDVAEDGEDAPPGEGPLVLVKGAPEAVLEMCEERRDDEGGTAELDADAMVEASESLAAEGLRVLAMAVGRGDDVVRSVKEDDPPAGLTFVGLQGLMDPPRPSAVQAVDDCHGAGIRVIMVTGDHARTASAIAHQVHLDRDAKAELREGRRRRRRGEREPAQIHVTYDARGMSVPEASNAAERIRVETHVPDAQDVQVTLDVERGDGQTGPAANARDASDGDGRADGRGASGDGELPEAHTGREVDELSDEQLDDILRRSNVFARVEPIQKTRIVDRLKSSGQIVAVTGDGVNDAPALKSAHLGAAMGSGTDVAKEASDMVITDDNFASVYGAVKQGRTAFRNIRMATFFLLSTGAADVLIILGALGMGWPLPLLAAQILWCNVVTNGIADVALAFEPGEAALYRRPPRPPQEGVLDRTLIERLVVVGIWLAVGVLGVFLWKWGFDFGSWDGSEENLTLARTAALTTLVLFQKVHVFNCRSEDVSIFKKSLFSNKLLFIGVLTSLGVHIAAVYLPWTQKLLSLTGLDAMTWAVAAGVAATAIVVNELHKWLRPRYG